MVSGILSRSRLAAERELALAKCALVRHCLWMAVEEEEVENKLWVDVAGKSAKLRTLFNYHDKQIASLLAQPSLDEFFNALAEKTSNLATATERTQFLKQQLVEQEQCARYPRLKELAASYQGIQPHSNVVKKYLIQSLFEEFIASVPSAFRFALFKLYVHSAFEPGSASIGANQKIAKEKLCMLLYQNAYSIDTPIQDVMDEYERAVRTLRNEIEIEFEAFLQKFTNSLTQNLMTREELDAEINQLLRQYIAEELHIEKEEEALSLFEREHGAYKDLSRYTVKTENPVTAAANAIRLSWKRELNILFFQLKDQLDQLYIAFDALKKNPHYVGNNSKQQHWVAYIKQCEKTFAMAVLLRQASPYVVLEDSSQAHPKQHHHHHHSHVSDMPSADESHKQQRQYLMTAMWALIGAMLGFVATIAIPGLTGHIIGSIVGLILFESVATTTGAFVGWLLAKTGLFEAPTRNAPATPSIKEIRTRQRAHSDAGAKPNANQKAESSHAYGNVSGSSPLFHQPSKRTARRKTHESSQATVSTSKAL